MKGTIVSRANRLTALGMLVLGLALSACGGSSETAAPNDTSHVTELAGGAIRVTLSADAARRLDVKTAPAVTEAGATVIPYDAVLYDPNGETWTYTNPTPLNYVRADITVDRIEGDRAILTKGPKPGTAVVTVGATELWGVEYGGIEED